MRKKIILLAPLLFGVILTVIFFSNNIYQDSKIDSENRIDPENKILFSDSLMATTVNPSMETGYNLSDAVVHGKIIDIYQKDIDFIATHEGSNKLGDNLPKITCTYYTIDVDECYLGNVDKQITYREVGDFNEFCTKPTDKSEVILFLNKRTDNENNIIYVSTMMEHSIITIDDAGKMYSYSNTEELSMFDGKNASEFKQSLEKTAKAHSYIQDKTITFNDIKK